MVGHNFDYYHHDGAYFRTRAGRHGVDDVMGQGGAWTPYNGDTLEPYWFGSRVDLADVEAAAKRQAERLANRRATSPADPANHPPMDESGVGTS